MIFFILTLAEFSLTWCTKTIKTEIKLIKTI